MEIIKANLFIFQNKFLKNRNMEKDYVLCLQVTKS